MNASASQETVQELFNRAFALHQANQPKNAQPLYEEVLARDPRHAHAIHSLGVIASADGRRGEAIQLFQQAIAVNGREAIFYHNLGLTLQADGRSTEAVQSLRKAVEINPEFLGAWQALAEIHYSLDHTNDAARAIRKVAELQTKTAEGHNQWGLALVKENRLKEAAEAFRAGMACNPRGAGLYFNAGNVLSALGQHADAVSCLTQAASLEPKMPKVYVFLSNARYRKGDLDAALRARARAWQLNPNLPEGNFEVSGSPIIARPQRQAAANSSTTVTLPQAIEQAVQRHNAGDRAAAETLYRKVLEIDPVNADALHLLGVVLHQRGDHRGALELIDRVVVRGNASANVHANRASIFISLGEFDAAEASGRRALEIDPTNKGARDNIAVAQRKRQDEARDAVSNPLATTEPMGEAAQKKTDELGVTLQSIPVPPLVTTLSQGELDVRYRNASICHQEGRLEEEERLYRQVLESNPTHNEALNYLGVLMLKRGKTALARELIERSIAINPNFAAAHSSLSAAFIAQRRFPEALASCERALQLDPGLAAALHNRGNVCCELGRYEEAIADYDRTLELQAGHIKSLLNRSVALRKLRRFEHAMESCERALAVHPNYPQAHEDRGNALLGLQRYDEALGSFQRALALKEDYVDAHRGVGATLLAMDDVTAAELWFRAGVRRWPTSAKSHGGLGLALLQQRHYEEATNVLQAAAALDPTDAEPLNNLGVIASKCGRHDEADRYYRKALELDPLHPSAALMRGMSLLSLGRYEEGWPLYDRKNDIGIAGVSSFGFPRWRGESLSGKSVLVLPEQGYGDDIQFSRYIPILKALGARHITLVCREPLVSLFETLDGGSTICDVGSASTEEPHDYWTLLLSVPRHCRTTLETIPAQLPYLKADLVRQQFWRTRIPEAKLRVGLVWKGNPANTKDRSRSLPTLATLAPLWSTSVRNCIFVSLQKGAGEEEALRPPADQPIVHLGTEIRDFADTAAIVSQLDLVICVDTAIGHLAGALNKPCWIMIPHHDADWRWLRERSDSPWYPGAIRLYRQAAPNEWMPVVHRLAQSLEAFSSDVRLGSDAFKS